jgi:peptidoglycan/xylan/chitin deacetylase (PgdA/CDA1 family)
MNPFCLFRYDTETDDADAMRGFLPKLVAVHRAHRIPVTLFCTGRMLEAREAEFRDFAAEVRGDPLFEIQSHSYSHIGVGYERGSSVEELRADYARAFAIHASVFGARPEAVSICGTGGKDGPRLKGFDQTEKARRELDMLAGLGVRRLNTFLSRCAEDRDFCDYAELGHPGITGFPSGFGDTGWMLTRTPGGKWRRREPFAAAVATITGEIRRRGEAGVHMPVMLHDWAAWTLAPDRELDHVKRFAEAAHAAGFELLTHDNGCRRHRAAQDRLHSCACRWTEGDEGEETT